jgi:uncharacterized membrane protein
MAGEGRLAAIDRLRGFIMAAMAIDHASMFVARRHSAEFWAAGWTRYDSAAWFLTRFVTHLCAPGFFFLMGVGMALLAASRRAAGWSEGRIATFLCKRGLLLLAINHVVENPAWLLGILSGRAGTAAGEAMPGSGGDPMVLFTVITGLGLCVVAAGLLLRFADAVWWAVAVAALGGSALLTPSQAHAATAFPVWMRLLGVPGQSGPAVVLYPLAPWLGIAALGVLYGRWTLRDRERALRVAPWMGAAMVGAALALRAAGGFGNLRLPRDGSWIEFLNFIKYPPALVFTLFMVGANLLLLRALRGEWLTVFGQTPLFFYLAHLYLYAAIGAVAFRDGASIGTLYAVWAAGLVPLYFACRRYRAFKQSKPPDSAWRFF